MRKSSGKRVPITDVAAAAGVSRSTASMILSRSPGYSFAEDTVRRVEDAARRLGHRPSLFSIGSQQSSKRLIAVYVGRDLSAFMGDRRVWIDDLQYMMTAFTTGCFRRNIYALTLAHPPDEDCEEEVRNRLLFLAQSGVGGIVALGPTSGVLSTLCDVARSGTSVVQVFGEPGNVPGLVTLDVDNRVMGLRATQSLHRAGYQRIACVKSPESTLALQDRETGYRTAIEHIGGLPRFIDIGSDYGRQTCKMSSFEREVMWHDSAKRAAEAITRSDADAFFVISSGATCILMDALRLLSWHTPEPYGVMGVGYPRDRTGRSVSSYSGPWDRYSDLALEILQAQMAGDKPSDPRHEVLEPVYTPGSTCRSEVPLGTE